MAQPNPETTEDLSIRPATPEDAEDALELFNEDMRALTSVERLEDDDLRSLGRTYLEPADSGFWIAELDGEVVGMIGVRAGNDHAAEICRLRVRLDHRRKGVGTRLLERAVGHCRERGLLKISLDVLPDRRPAIDLFAKTGFRLNREREVANRIQMDFYIDLYQDRGA